MIFNGTVTGIEVKPKKGTNPPKMFASLTISDNDGNKTYKWFEHEDYIKSGIVEGSHVGGEYHDSNPYNFNGTMMTSRIIDKILIVPESEEQSGRETAPLSVCIGDASRQKQGISSDADATDKMIEVRINLLEKIAKEMDRREWFGFKEEDSREKLLVTVYIKMAG